jgi:hypothetical protein
MAGVIDAPREVVNFFLATKNACGRMSGGMSLREFARVIHAGFR